MHVSNRTSLSPESFAAILDQLPEHENLRQVMQWALADRNDTFIPGAVSQVVAQDEFSLDVIVPWRDGLVLVYDATCVGGVTAVAVWDRIPTADELLQTRLETGWQPRPSVLKEGDVVVGHAACAVLNGAGQEPDN
jgi:hypothetical protein